MDFEFKFTPDELNSFPNENKAILYKFATGRKKDIIKANKDLLSGRSVFHIQKKSIDARRKPEVYINYKVNVYTKEEFQRLFVDDAFNRAYPYINQKISIYKRPVIAGFGPAGLFAALILSNYGIKPIVIERGSIMDKRINDVEAYISGKTDVNPESNIQFGEGGAGTFSDGKLNTGVSNNSKYFVYDTFIKFGAPGNIIYDSHPHIGTDNLRIVISNMRKKIIELGGEILFDTKLTDMTFSNNRVSSIQIEKDGITQKIDTDDLILAIGHSSRDTFRRLFDLGIDMENKPFSVGVRIEHLQKEIDFAQYGFDTSNYHDISAASYKLAVDTSTGKKLYTFCMCPGGYVMASSSIPKQICTNGMSNYKRDNINANSALLVPVDSSDYGDGVLAGIEFQNMLEKKAFELAGSNNNAPFSTFKAFKNNEISNDYSRIVPSYMPGVTKVNLNELFPEIISKTISEGITNMGKKIKGFDADDAILTAVEARSSSPVRITRNPDTLESTNIIGLYPCGEGAGYAGGITSAALDGIKCANALVSKYLEKGI